MSHRSEMRAEAAEAWALAAVGLIRGLGHEAVDLAKGAIERRAHRHADVGAAAVSQTAELAPAGAEIVQADFSRPSEPDEQPLLAA